MWGFIRIIFNGVFGLIVLNLFNLLELAHGGSFVHWFIIMFIEIHTVSGGNMLEQLFFGDIGMNIKFGTVDFFKKNMLVYLPYSL